jgi:hypothetical protein
MVFVNKLRRPTALAAAALLLLASFVPLLASQTASAYVLLGNREIRMSSAVGGDADVSYRVDFVIPAGITNLQGVVVTFCEESPIIGDEDCTAPAGLDLDVSGTNAAVDLDEGDVDLSGFTQAFANIVSGGGGEENTLTLSDGTGVAVSASDSVVFTIPNVTNPTAVNETFYARIMLYDDNDDATGYSVADNNEPVQAGGIAMSTAELITIEAKVQERITFCVFTGTPTSFDGDDCNVVTDPVVLGDSNGVLDFETESISKDAHYAITTNAGAGATIRMKGDSTLTSGSFSIDEIGATAAASDTGTEQFGMCTYRNPGSAAGLTPVAPYNHADCDQTTDGQGAGNADDAEFAFDLTSSDGVDSEYGQAIATKAAGDWSTGVLVFLGNISTVTEPGIYTTDLNFIATGRY